MLQSSLGIGMSQMALHVFNGGMVLHVRGRSAPEHLVRQIMDTGLLAQRFEISLEVVADTKRIPR